MSVPARVIVVGPLAEHAEGYWAHLTGLGYTPWSATGQLRLMAHLSRWMAGERLEPARLTDEQIDRFVAARRAGHTHLLSVRGLAPLLGFLRACGVIPAPVAVNTSEFHEPVRRILEDFGVYLSRERGLQPATVSYYRVVAASFLSGRVDRRPAVVEATAQDRVLVLTAADVTEFLLAQARTGRSLPHQSSALRALLRFLHLQGYTAWSLSGTVVAAARWRRRLPPRALPAPQVTRLLDSCDERTTVGRRDRAVLLLMARLGLRAGEVAALRLEDIDWRAGQIMVRGKADRWEYLPLPADVGAALAGYLRWRRPGDEQRQVFLRVRAPRAPLTTRGVCSVMRNACTRAGLPAAGAHRLRHSAATEIRRVGAPLSEVSQLLRHRRVSATAVYTRFDRSNPADIQALRELARPWPQPPEGGAR
jgi:integrase/recombinase XerD